MGHEGPPTMLSKPKVEDVPQNVESLKRELSELESLAAKELEEYEALKNKAFEAQPHFKGVDVTQDNSRVDREIISDLREGRKATNQMIEEKKDQYERTVAKIRDLYYKLNTNSLDRKF